MTVLPLSKPGRLPLNYPSVQVHRDTVLDYEFNPFNPYLLATGGEDCHIKLTTIPEHGPTANITEATGDLEGHERKINILHWHPTANNILGSASADLTVRVWDAGTGQNALTFQDFGDVVQSFDWNPVSTQYIHTYTSLKPHLSSFPTS